ncbi:MAG: class I SAM-dependent methyltransferase [Actinobacteria bacterium]|nr:class I SAM-dependent methyltransferase [Actinomycetota bacterium]
MLSISGEPVEYERHVAVIHIDGNHDYSSVREDCELWLTRLVPGAWLILDDYIWAHGDGPYRMGNELLRDEVDRIERAFVSGKALFVKFH